MTAVETEAVEYEYSEQGFASCCRGVRSFAGVQRYSMRISQGVEIVPGCVVTVCRLPFFLS